MTLSRKVALRALIFSFALLVTTRAHAQVDADAAHITDKGPQVSSTSICHGEHEKKQINFDVFRDTRSFKHSCGDHPGFALHEGCGGDGANPAASAASLCRGKPYYTTQTNFPGVEGNQCGYSWFTIICWSGP